MNEGREVLRVAPSTVRRTLIELVGKARAGTVIVIEADRLPVATILPVSSVEEAIEIRQQVGQ